MIRPDQSDGVYCFYYDMCYLFNCVSVFWAEMIVEVYRKVYSNRIKKCPPVLT